MPRFYGQRKDGHRDVLLTFDDGPSVKTTPRLLDTLARHDIVDTLDWKKKNGEWVDHGMEQVKLREDPIVLMPDIHATTVDNVKRLTNRIKRIPGARFTLY